MKTPVVLLLVCYAAGAPCRAGDLVGVGGGEALVNGGFESFTGGVPVGWTYERGDGPASLESAVFISPFPSPFGSSTRSVLLTDGTASQPRLSQNFAPLSGVFSMTFDFRLNGPLAGAAWSVLPTASGGEALFNLGLDQGGDFRISSGQNSFPVSGLLASTWYHVEVEGSTGSERYGGSIRPFGGAPTFWTDFAFAGNQSGLTGLVIDDEAAGLANTALVLDNFSLEPVPEPGFALWCSAAAGALVLVRRLRRND